MGGNSAALIGAALCCLTPLLAFASGVYYARHGLPVVIRWRGREELDD